jgi:gamma-glutamylcyclotransferase (GGCT)/AIG2-like uncharacterized protein YtfP
MTQLVFFYGTLMAGFARRREAALEDRLEFLGRGSIEAALFDLGDYPAAVPAPGSRVAGELYAIAAGSIDSVLLVLDEVEGFLSAKPRDSLYRRIETPVHLDDGGSEVAWVYFYNQPLGEAAPIPGGDYLKHVAAR